jgi:hypothetical protein
MDNITKKTRLEYLLEKFKTDYKRGIDKKLFSPIIRKFELSISPENIDKMDAYYDNEFYSFSILYQPDSMKYEKQYEKIFYFLVDCDPSDNKEYVSWLMNMYSQTIKDRVSIAHGYTDNILTRDEISNFFEDAITKGKEALEVFTFLKKTNILNVNSRDINQFKTLNTFINTVKPYMNRDDGDDSVHTLDHKELQCIHNYVTFGKDSDKGVAELVFENDKWVVVITHNKLANSDFGKYTTWCTAGTRWGNMFDSYHGRGELFVLIRKGYGSKNSIKKHPEYRLQFHFEDNQFMDANDKRINVNKFLQENKELKSYFKHYLVNTALPRRRSKNLTVRHMDEINYLLELGFGDEIIKILKETKTESIDFSGHVIDSEYLENIGEVTSIKRMDLSECKLTHLPESIKHLKDLKYFKFRNNPLITVIPDWISELTNLETLDCAGCGLLEIGDISGNINLKDVVVDFNKNLKSLPKNIGKLTKLARLTAASCDIRSVDDDIINCPLYLLDIHNNEKLSYIPIKLSSIPSIQAIVIDGTSVSNDTIKEMEAKSNGSVCILKYT